MHIYPTPQAHPGPKSNKPQQRFALVGLHPEHLLLPVSAFGVSVGVSTRTYIFCPSHHHHCPAFSQELARKLVAGPMQQHSAVGMGSISLNVLSWTSFEVMHECHSCMKSHEQSHMPTRSLKEAPACTAAEAACFAGLASA